MAWNSKTSITNFFSFLQKTQLVSYNSATNPLLQNKSLILQAWMCLLLTTQEYQGKPRQKLPALIRSSMEEWGPSKDGVEPWSVSWSFSPPLQFHGCSCSRPGRKPAARWHVWHRWRHQLQPGTGRQKLLSPSFPLNSLIMPYFHRNSLSRLFAWLKNSVV